MFGPGEVSRRHVRNVERTVTSGEDRGRERIAFVQTGPFPYANVFVAEQLRRNFPACEVDVINVLDLLRSDRRRLARAAVETARVYGVDIATGRRQFRAAALHTPYFFRQARELVLARLRQVPYLFSFQMQSLFDASPGHLPHFIYTDHTNLANLAYDLSPQSAVYPARWRRLETSIYENATLVFVRSLHVERSLVEQYGFPQDRIKLVYAGSNAGTPPTADKGFDGDRFAAKRILFVGSDWRRKGGPTLLEAFRQVREVHPDAELVLVGKTPPINEPNVTVLGELPLDRVSHEYQRSTVFCVPTLREPFGIVFVEAMSYGMPVVATKIGALPDMVEDGVNGYLVAPGDVRALAEHLITLLREADLVAAMGARSMALASDRYNWDAVGRKMATHIRNALAAAATPNEA